jgi:hypothetical protein
MTDPPEGYIRRSDYDALVAKCDATRAKLERVRADTARIQLQIGEVQFFRAIYRQWLTDYIKKHPEVRDDGRRTDDSR